MKITKDMKIDEIIEKKPNAVEIMFKYGLHCIGCAVASYESLEDGAKAHGLKEEDIEKMIKEINEIEEK